MRCTILCVVRYLMCDLFFFNSAPHTHICCFLLGLYFFYHNNQWSCFLLCCLLSLSGEVSGLWWDREREREAEAEGEGEGEPPLVVQQAGGGSITWTERYKSDSNNTSPV